MERLDNKIYIINDTIDAIDLIRQKSVSGDDNDEPFYICNLSDVIRKDQIWKEYMPRVCPFFAIKSNADPVVIQTLVNLGTGFDCASKGEIEKVMKCGATSESIIFASPTKLVSHLKFAAEKNVDLMTVDSEFELHKVLKHYPKARLILRIRYEAQSSFCSLGKKYGCHPVTEAPGLIELSKSLGLNMIGISFHVGSGCLDPPVFANAIEASRKLFDFAESVGYHFRMLDIGGGFPGAKNTSIKEYASIINSSIDLNFPSPDIKIIAEPGRFYVASAYTLACQVHSVREIHENGKLNSMMYYINDGVYGSFFNVMSYKVINPNLKIWHPLTLKPANEELIKSTIWGPTCDSIDEVRDDVLLPRLIPSDFIIFENMGAYTISSASNFNGFPLPNVEYYVERQHCGNVQRMSQLCSSPFQQSTKYKI